MNNSANMNSWNTHYRRERSQLHYPDENLVRMLAPYFRENDPSLVKVLDLGSGSGRHVHLLRDFGVNTIIAADMSFNSAKVSTTSHSTGVQCYNKNLPFKCNTFDCLVSWGSLHYSLKDELAPQINEILRVLKPDGYIFGTLRSDRDTMLKSGTHLGNNVWKTDLNDISGCIVSFFSEDELKQGFSDFSEFTYGLIERTPLGDTSHTISHWYFKARK